jgi:hypothetical protein
MYKHLSGAKSVKQYRGDENLPEAKKGMKNCGCKHSKSKYKYQSGERDIAADKLEFGDNINSNTSQELELPEGDVPMTYAPKVQKASKTKPVVTRNIDTTKRRVPKTFPSVGGEKKIFIEKTPVTRSSSTELNAPRKREMEYTSRVQKYVDNLSGDLIPQRKTTYSLDRDNNKMVRHSSNTNKTYGRKKLGYTYEDLTPEEQKQVQYEQKLRTANKLREDANVLNKSSKYRKDEFQSSGSFNKAMNIKGVNDMVSNVKKFTSSVEGKSGYKYGTGAIAIPEGSAIVTANKGKNKQALMAYKKGNYKLLNNIIDDMPEDNVDKKQAGVESLEAKYKRLGELTGPLSPAQQKEFADLKSQLTEDEYDIYDDKRIAEKFGQKYDVDKAKWKSSLKGGKLNLKEDTANAKYRESLRDPKVLKAAIAAGKVKVDAKGNISYTAKGGSAKGNQEFLGTAKRKALSTLQGSEDLKKGPPASVARNNTFATSKRGGDFLRNIPSLAEIAARASILGQGVEGVPENYLSLGRYNYASQLPKILAENTMDANAAKQIARNVSGGNVGNYLANASDIYGSKLKANNLAVIDDTLARQDILNKNVDLGNVESQTNRSLKDQYAALRGQARANYNDQLVALGQRIDSATETSQEMSNQRGADDQRMQVLKDLGLNYEYKNVDGLMKLVPKAKGAKKLKTYKRK